MVIKDHSGTGNPGGRGCANQKVFCGGGMDIFWNHTFFKCETSTIWWKKFITKTMRSCTGDLLRKVNKWGNDNLRASEPCEPCEFRI